MLGLTNFFIKYKIYIYLGVILMDDYTLIKGSIYEFDSNQNFTLKDSIIFKVINVNNTYFFAQEISTNCIFPIFNYLDNAFYEFSFLKEGKYYINYPLVGNEKNFKFKVSQNKDDFIFLEIPSDDETNKYLEEKTSDLSWQEKIEYMESQNKYIFDLEKIKKHICNVDEKNIKFEKVINYESSINLKEISHYGYDLATQDKLCNLIGRDEEIKKAIKATCIRKKSVLLIGEPGSGKTSIVEKIALDIKTGKNYWLENKVIFYLSLTSCVAGTNYRGEFEKNLDIIINYCKNNKDKIILFIDEIHNLYGLGASREQPLDGMNILKPYITNGTLTIIGATTKKEYEKFMINDPAFLERFEKINVSLPDDEMNLKILLSYIKELEEEYNIYLNLNDSQKNEYLKHIIKITHKNSQKIIGDIKISNPRISKSIIEEAFAEAVYNRQQEVTINDICLSILSCDRLSPTFRKEQAQLLKNILVSLQEETNSKEPISNIKELKKVRI